MLVWLAVGIAYAFGLLTKLYVTHVSNIIDENLKKKKNIANNSVRYFEWNLHTLTF